MTIDLWLLFSGIAGLVLLFWMDHREHVAERKRQVDMLLYLMELEEDDRWQQREGWRL